jgi:hypothetical protein
MEQEEQNQDDSKVKILGHYRSRKELFWNGVVFLVIEQIYKAFNLFSQLPEGYRDNPELLEDLELQQPSFIVLILLFFVGYVLIDRSVFGSDVGKNVEKWGMSGYFRRKFTLALIIILVTLLADALVALIILV